MTNYTQLYKEDRDSIEELLKKGYSFTDIAKEIKKDRTTISKEIRRNRIIRSSFFTLFNEKGIQKAVNSCERLKKPPYVCNNCPFKNSCTKYHLYYNAKAAQSHADEIKSESRKGIDATEEEINIINKNIVPLIKDKKQSVNQVFANHTDILPFTKTTFYTYVNNGIINLTNLDLPRKVKYKKRNKKDNKEYKRELSILINRTYEDYIIRLDEEKDKKLNIWQLDTVIGLQTDNKCLLTFLMVETNFMLIRLLDKKEVYNVDEEFTKIKNALSSELYKNTIDIILTDNGIEFYDPIHLEHDLDTGEKLCSVYYCHPNSPDEKPEIEKNHEYIRYVLPKKTSFEHLTKEDIKLLEDNINNIPRDILGGKTPYELTKEKFPELIKRIGSNYIQPDDVTLNKKYIIGGENHE